MSALLVLCNSPASPVRLHYRDNTTAHVALCGWNWMHSEWAWIVDDDEEMRAVPLCKSCERKAAR